MPGAATAETSQDTVDREATWVAANRDAVTAATHAAAVAEAARLVVTADKLEVDAASAQQEATHVGAALAAASPSEESAIVPPPPSRDDDIFRAYAAAQVNAVITSLHTQAIFALNVKVMIPVYLDNLSPQYNRCKALFLNTLSKYELSNHVLAGVTPEVTTDPHWWQMDWTVRSWLYDSHP
jgi:hypothetical protein